MPISLAFLPFAYQNTFEIQRMAAFNPDADRLPDSLDVKPAKPAK